MIKSDFYFHPELNIDLSTKQRFIVNNIKELNKAIKISNEHYKLTNKKIPIYKNFKTKKQ